MNTILDKIYVFWKQKKGNDKLTDWPTWEWYITWNSVLNSFYGVLVAERHAKLYFIVWRFYWNEFDIEKIEKM